MTQSKSEKILRGVLEACSDCDTCRFLMDESCLLFPELYRLYDKEKELGRPVRDLELQKMSELCTFCGLCPCPKIRSDVIQGKSERVNKEGMPLGIRLLADAQRLGRWGSLGFKKDFHEASVKLGKPLMRKIQATRPTAIITDCLSCRLQFQHMLPFPVYHPLEIISGAYEAFQIER